MTALAYNPVRDRLEFRRLRQTASPRGIGWSCSKVAIKVVLDDRQNGEIRERECVKIAVEPGEHVLKGIKQALVKPRDLICEADPGKNVYIRGDCSNDSRNWE